jgi:hypothetical protein
MGCDARTLRAVGLLGNAVLAITAVGVLSTLLCLAALRGRSRRGRRLAPPRVPEVGAS